MTNAVAIAQQGSNNTTFRNRIINGACAIDQRNAGASINGYPNATYCLDRWGVQNNSGASRFTVQQNAGSVTPPAGFAKYLGVTSTSAYSVGSTDVLGIYQNIEGFNTADLNWGTANAKAITVSFWVYSSLTGTYSAAIKNATDDYSYLFNYSISSANTWTYVTQTVPGPTGGTWVGATNGIGVKINFNLGSGSTYSGATGSWIAQALYGSTGSTSLVGTNGATWYLTGVQLEAGSAASPFEMRSFTTELQLCQRYCYVLNDSTQVTIASAPAYNNNTLLPYVAFPVTTRASCTGVTTSGSFTSYQNATLYGCNAPTFNNGSLYGCEMGATASSSTWTAGYCSSFRINNGKIIFTGMEL